ncbi:MAG: FAD-dependent monooxygenase [Bacteroidetes bacterium]|nr:FAD-dependent monooxygenase [Bacteroidota bacterium]
MLLDSIVDLVATPAQSKNETEIRKLIRLKLNLTGDFYFKLLKRSIDARSKNIKINLRVQVSSEPLPETNFFIPQYASVEKKRPVAIIGSGPAGLFAALTLLERGIKPVIFERGKNVRDRRRDLAAINKEGIINPESNYCFGEGGAGTYSDGKLYTRSDKRGNIKSILETFVRFGADKDILVDAHPHIGTNKLPDIIQKMREVILDSGGEIHFNAKVTDIEIQFDAVTSLQINNTDTFKCDQIILATGHSARDIFELLHKRKILIEAKPFALGVRIEHPQQIIDKMQYHCDSRGEYLPPASYSIVKNFNGRGVYSFCMCPGGIIAPCATNNNEVVTNGWSPSKRNNPFANSGFVVSIELSDLKEFQKYGPLAGMYFQKEIEEKCFIAGGKNQGAPAQRMIDFVNNKLSSSLPDCSYQPGIISISLDTVLPEFIINALRNAFLQTKDLRSGYFTNEAVLVAPESRTSSPIKIPRDENTLQHIQIKGLFPCGEGAGYAGGIISAAIDGIRVGESVNR